MVFFTYKRGIKMSNIIDFKRAVLILSALILFFTANLFFTPKGRISTSAAAKKGKFVPIIMYHGVTDGECDAGEYIVTAAQLESDLKYLKAHGYTTIIVNDLIRYVNYKGKLPEKPVILTFDDGMYGVYKYAYPLMEKYGARCSVSVVGSYTIAASESAEEPSAAYSYLSLDNIAKMRRSGLVEICSHSYDMHSLEGRRGALPLEDETYEQYRKAIYNDVFAVQELMEDSCGFRPNVYTYPFGFKNNDTQELVNSCGFEATMGVEEKPNYIVKNDPSTLFSLNRYNRSGYASTETFMKKALSRE